MPTQTVFLIILAVIVAAGLAWGHYFFQNKKGKRVKHWPLFCALRFVTLFCVFLLLLNLSFAQRNYTIQKPTLVLAVDNSSSIADFEQTSAVRHFVHQLQQNPEIRERFQIETYTFGKKFRKNDSLDFTEPQTNLSTLFSNLSDLYQDQTAPTVLISDGNQTYGQDYSFASSQYNQPIYPVVVGDTAAYTDLQIDRLNVNHFAFLNNNFPVEVFINYTGKKTINQRFEIKAGQKVVFSKSINFSKEKTSAIITAKLPAKKVGVQPYTATIVPLSEEKNKVNNTARFAVETIDEKTNVLLLYDALHPDLGSLKKSIEHNQQRQATLKKVDGPVLDFAKYQLVVFYQPDSKFEKAYQRVNKLGLNTLTITGPHTDYGFLNRHQPYFQKELTAQQEDYLPVFNEHYQEYQQKNIGFDDFPPLQDKFGNLVFQKRAQVLLYQRIQGVNTKQPLLATVEENGKRHGFLFGENAWRWRAKSFLETQSFKNYDEFIGKLVQYLASNQKKDRLRVDFDSFYNAGEKIIMSAQYFDENYQFDPRAKLSAVIRNKKTDKTRTFPFLLKNNHYQLNLSSLSAGEYTFTVTVDGEHLTKSGDFKIIDFQVEKQFLNANTRKLEKLGMPLNFLDKPEPLVKSLLGKDQFKPVQKSVVQNSPLINWVYLLIIIVISLTVEWFLRKYNGLI